MVTTTIITSATRTFLTLCYDILSDIFSKFLYCICQQVELRAFCSKHTELPNDRDTHQLGEAFVSASHDCSVASHNPSTLQMDKQRKLNIGQNGDKLAVHTETSDTNSGKPGDGELWEIGLFDSRSNAEPLSESGDLDKLIDMGIFERGGNEGAWTAFVCEFFYFSLLEKAVDFFFNFLEIGWFEEEFNSLNLFFTFLDNDKV
jgi:hypothetical protein